MKLALLGTGMIVQELLPVLAELGIRPRALLGTERSRERTAELAARFGIEGVYFRYEALLEGRIRYTSACPTPSTSITPGGPCCGAST